MLKLGAALVVAVLLTAQDPIQAAPSQPPIPSTSKISGNHQTEATNGSQETKADQRGTEAAPLVVKIKTTSQADKEAANEATYQKQEATNNGHLFVITCILAAIAVLQWGAMLMQAIYARRTAESFISGERPHIFIGKATASFFSAAEQRYIETDGPTAEVPKIAWTFRNLGRTAAIVEEIRAELFFGPDLPKRKKYSFSEPTTGQTVVPSEKDSSPFTTEYERVITNKEIKEILALKKDFFLFGHIKYTDAFAYRHTYNFAFRVIQNRKLGGLLMIEGGSEYNGTDTEKM